MVPSDTVSERRAFCEASHHIHQMGAMSLVVATPISIIPGISKSIQTYMVGFIECV